MSSHERLTTTRGVSANISTTSSHEADSIGTDGRRDEAPYRMPRISGHLIMRQDNNYESQEMANRFRVGSSQVHAEQTLEPALKAVVIVGHITSGQDDDAVFVVVVVSVCLPGHRRQASTGLTKC